MSEDTVTVLDENTRRYYLDVMGIQCWELLGGAAEAGSGSDIETDRSSDADTGFQQLEMAVQQCTQCQLHASRKQAILGRGNQSAELMFVLLSPDSIDDAAGVVCSGDAGTLFAKMLAAINVSIDDVYITSLLKCSVPALHTISTSEISRCNDYLKQQVSLVQPKLLVVLGDTAARCLLQNDSPLDELRAQVNSDLVNSDMVNSGLVNTGAGVKNEFESVPLFVSYSPKELVAQPGNKRKAWLDLQQIQKKIKG